jgi:xanthine dehydrogenase accessory factor
MTKEIRDIINAFEIARQEGRHTALATVVHVEGSSYRRPGARMLVEDNGKITGAISGGCLEGDALRKALNVIHHGQNKLVTYNTLDDEDKDLGVQLGCNGIVHILFEPIKQDQPDNAIALLQQYCSGRMSAAVVTLFSLDNFCGPQPGTCFFYNAISSDTRLSDTPLLYLAENDAMAALTNRASELKQYVSFNLTAFIEIVQPALSLIIVGAGNDALPLVAMATTMGWRITLVDGRATHANARRFPDVGKILVGKPEQVVAQLGIDDRTVIVFMTHNYNYDLAMLPLLLPFNCPYIGMLGPRKRLDSILEEVAAKGIGISDEHRNRIYGPVGLDIGAETPEEIALCILAEIKAVMAGHRGGFLRSRNLPIHARPVQRLNSTPDVFQSAGK